MTKLMKSIKANEDVNVLNSKVIGDATKNTLGYNFDFVSDPLTFDKKEDRR